MESREIQNYDDEMTIDLAHFAVSVMKKWKSLVVLVIIGALLGMGMQFLPKSDATRWSREDAALIETMKVASLARSRYEDLERYVKDSPFMRLDSQSVFTSSVEYYIPKCEDPDQIAASFNALLGDEEIRGALCGILGISNEMDLDKMLTYWPSIKTDTKIVGDMQVELKEKVILHVSVYAANRDQAQQVLDLLCETIEQLPEKVSPKQNFELVQISRNIKNGVASSLRDAQNDLRTELNEAHKNYTTLEKDFDEAQYALYEAYVLTGKTSEMPTVLFPSNPLKKPVILAFVFAFLGCAWYAVAYFLSGKVKTVDEAASITRRNVLGFINTAAPRKCFIDRWLDSLEAHSFPAPVSPDYAAAAAGKLDKAVVVYDETDAQLHELAQQMGIPAMGLMAQDSRTLSAVGQDTNVILLVKLGSSTKMQLQRETDMCRQYGIPMAGSIVVK